MTENDTEMTPLHCRYKTQVTIEIRLITNIVITTVLRMTENNKQINVFTSHDTQYKLQSK